MTDKYDEAFKEPALDGLWMKLQDLAPLAWAIDI
jgi:hypothetical protein